MAVRDFPPRPQGAAPDSVPYQNWLDALRERQNIDALQELTSVATGDELTIFDVSETGNVKTKKATVSNIASGAGAVIGPASATDNAIALFNGTTGKIIKDSATLLSALMAYGDTRFKVGSFTRDMSVASGTQAVTGVGFSPKFVFGIASISGGGDCMSIGFSDATTNGCAAWGSIIAANYWYRNPVFVRLYRNAAGTNYYSGNLSSLDSDGFTVSWTKTGTPTGTLTVDYVAFR